MRIIPKKIKVKNTVWKCYSMPDIIIALVMFALIFVCITFNNWVMAVILGLLGVVMFMPTQDGIFYSCIFDNIKFLFAKKKYTATAKNEKETIDNLIGLKAIKDNGLIEFSGGLFGRVIKIGQKNFGIEDAAEQNTDINYFANALKQLDLTQCADLVKIDRPVNLDIFASDLFDKLSVINSLEDKETQKVRYNILRERIDRIDKLNNLKKQYLSDYYIVVYGKNETDLENTALNIASEIGKCGLNTKIQGMRETAIFLKYTYSRNFDEREIKGLKDGELLAWVKPKEVQFYANRYVIDGMEAAVLAVADYPLRVKNAWGSELFNIPNSKVVMHIKSVEKYKAVKRIDKCISEMETKQLISEKASEANSAETHRETMGVLLNSLQTENESLLDVTLTVTAFNYLNDNNYKKTARKAMLTNNFKVSTLYGLQIEGFKSAGISNKNNTLKNYERGINSSSLAAAFPFVRTFVMDEGGILLGENKNNRYPFIFNIWKRGNLYQNSNAMVIGKSGSGKSFFLKNLILNEWANGTRVIVLDPEGEYVNLTHNLSGNVIDVGNAKEGRINPFHIYKILTEDGTPAEPVVTFNTHLKMLESFFKIVLEGAAADVIELINNLVLETYESKGITETTDCTGLKAEAFPLFTDLLKTLQDKNKESVDSLTLRDMRTAELYLQKFVSGRYSDIWNAPSTLQVNANLIDFNFQSLFANKNNVVANAQMLLIFRFIEQEIINARELNKSGKNLHTMIICDEGHLFIDAKFPIALDFFYSMNKRIRKYGGSFIPATQNIADWNSSEELRGKTSTILKNSQYTFIFKLSAPDMKDVLDVYKAGDSFNEDEQRLIISAVTGQVFFIGSTELRTCVNIVAGEYAKQLFDENKT